MIRRRLVAAVVGVVAVIVALAAVVVVARLEDRLISNVDHQLESLVRDIAKFEDTTLAAGEDGTATSPFEVREVAFIRIDSSGRIVQSGPSGPQTDPDPLPDMSGLEAPAEPTTVPSVGSDEPRYRVLATTRDDGSTVVIGISLARADASVDYARDILAVAFGVALVAVAGVVWFTIRRGLRPIDHMILTAQRIAAGDLTERTVVANPATEVGHLGSALNSMLDRIEEALESKTASESRVRRFAADASHELRTPLTSIRGYAELYRQGATTPGEVARGMERIEREAARMGLLVEDLLLLARLDQGRPLERGPVDLAELARVSAADAGAVDPDRHVELDVPDRQVIVAGDADRLRQVFDNLLANIREHTDPGTQVEVRVSRDGAWGKLTVADDGPGMAPEEVERAFDRFWQADPTTDHRRSGTGLGLAIVADIVRAHGGTVDMHSSPGDGATIAIALPLTDF